RLEHALADEVDVAPALAKVGVAEGVEAQLDLAYRRAHGPCGALSVISDVTAGAVYEHRVLHHEEMSVEDGGVLSGALLHHALAERCQPLHRFGEAGLEARDLV